MYIRTTLAAIALLLSNIHTSHGHDVDDRHHLQILVPRQVVVGEATPNIIVNPAVVADTVTPVVPAAVPGVAATTTPIPGVVTTPTPAAVPVPDPAATLKTTPAAAAVPEVTPTTAADPAAATTTPALTTEPATHTTKPKNSATTPKTTPTTPAAPAVPETKSKTSTTTSAIIDDAIQGLPAGGAAGGGNGSPNTDQAPPNVFTATSGSGSMLDYGSCLEFEEKCVDMCTHGLYKMRCENGGLCLCYENDPDKSSTNGPSDNEKASDARNDGNDDDDDDENSASTVTKGLYESVLYLAFSGVQLLALFAASAAFV